MNKQIGVIAACGFMVTVCAMERPQTIGQKGLAITGVVRQGEQLALDHVERPKTLSEYLGILPHNNAFARDIKNKVKDILIGKGGWWYHDVALPHDSFVGAVAVDEHNNQVLTGDDKGVLRRWNLANNTEVAAEEELKSKMFYKQNMEAAIMGELNAIVLAPDSSRKIAVFENRVVIDGNKIKKRVIDKEANFIFKAAYLHPDPNVVFLLSYRFSNDIHHMKNSAYQRSLVQVIALDTKEVVNHYQTCLFKTNKMRCAGALAPSGKMFTVAEGSKLRLLTQNFKGLFTWQIKNELICALAFNAEGTKFVAGCADGSLFWFDAEVENLRYTNSGSYMDYSVANEIADIKFHPSQKILFVGTQRGEVRLHDFDCNLLRKLCSYRVLREIAVFGEGASVVSVGSNHSAVIPGNNNAVVIWRKFEKPTLEQVLLRQVLKKYLITCIATLTTPEVCKGQDEVPVWMARKFNLDENELSQTWQSMPEKLRQSIFNTLQFRAQEIAKAAKHTQIDLKR